MKILKISTKEREKLASRRLSTMQTKKYLEENMYQLSHEYVVSMSEHDSGSISNVIRGLKKHVFATSIEKDNFENLDLRLFYINGENEIGGFALDINTKGFDWMSYVISYAMFLSKKYEAVGAISAYNTFISQIRTALEKLDFFTITLDELDDPKYHNSEIIVPNPRGIVILRFEDKLAVYKGFFEENRTINDEEDKQNKVYLMYSAVSNLIKIGRSINPRGREKTLQGQDPKLDIITYWIAPIYAEKELQNMFIHKRKRGEWFDLDFGDLVQIRDYMNKYVN